MDKPFKLYEILKRYVVKYIRRFGLLGLIIGLTVMSLDCTSAPKALERDADFAGFISEIHPVENRGTLGRVLVKSHADKLVDEYMVTINDQTLIFKQAGENRREASFEALETTQRVKIWFTGPILESFPMQGTAQQVVIE